MTVKVVLALSGGLDSLVLLAELLRSRDPEQVTCLSFSYGSKHNERELHAARAISDHYKVSRVEIDLSDAFPKTGSSLMDPSIPVPEGHHESPAMKSTVVPCRNLVFAGVLAAFADVLGASHVALGVHGGDRAVYPDCRAEFIQSLNGTVKLATDGRVKLYAPFLDWDKTQVVRHGMELRVPFHLSWTCYLGGEGACGKCSACYERSQAFANNKTSDPIRYELKDQ